MPVVGERDKGDRPPPQCQLPPLPTPPPPPPTLPAAATLSTASGALPVTATTEPLPADGAANPSPPLIAKAVALVAAASVPETVTGDDGGGTPPSTKHPPPTGLDTATAAHDTPDEQSAPRGCHSTGRYRSHNAAGRRRRQQRATDAHGLVARRQRRDGALGRGRGRQGRIDHPPTASSTFAPGTSRPPPPGKRYHRNR